jgi:hypothetical protein
MAAREVVAAMIRRQATVGGALAAVLLTAGLLTAGCSASVGAQVPATLPTSVHILPGTVLAASVDSAQWQVWVRSPDVIAGYKKARALLLAAGYKTTYDNLYSTSGEGQFCTNKYCIDVNAYKDPVYGKSVGYVVYRNSALGLPNS